MQLKRCCVGASLNAMKLQRDEFAIATAGKACKLHINTDMSPLFPVPEITLPV
jgi:hypothetical protein